MRPHASFRRRLVVAARLLALAALAASPIHAQPGADARAAIDRQPVDRLLDGIRAGTYGNVDHLLVLHGDEVLVDERFPRDYVAISRGKRTPIGCGADACTSDAEVHPFNYLHPRFHPWWEGGNVHTLQSVTKSVTATLIGIAQQRGEIAGTGVPLLSFFDKYDLSRVDPRLRQATLADLLTMRSGIEWHESDRPLDSTNTTIQLERSDDWIRFTLAQPMDAAPGTKWVYNSGGSQLMSEVIRRATGMHADAYAERHLFAPLGIRTYHWKRTPTGHPDTEGGLYLAPRDLAKIGQLYLNDGVWNGTRLLPAGWAREATARHVDRISDNPNAPGYGYQWWRYDRRGVPVWAGNGFGGQFLVVLPEQRMVGVINAWNVFGDRVQGTLGPLIDAMLDAAGVPAPQAGNRQGSARSAAPASAPVVFTNVSVIPMDRDTVLADRTVVVANGRITWVGGPRQAPAGATVVDGRGKYLMPGLAEFHAHVPSGAGAVHAHRTLTLYALAGVTTARGMLGAPLHLALRDSIARGQLLGPRLLTSGPSFNGNSVTSPAVAATMVRDQKAAGYDLLKIHPGVPRAAYDSLAGVANALGIPFAGHVPLEVGLEAALAGKYSTIDHLDGVIEAMYAGPQPLTPQQNGFFGLGIVRQLDTTRLESIVRRVRASGVAMVPTQILIDNYANDATGEALTSGPEFRYWLPQQVAAWRTTKNNLLAQGAATAADREAYLALRRRIIKRMYDAGIPFLLGSDAPQLWNVPGFSAHRELASLVAAGLTPYQALRTGTVDVARFLGEEGRSGVVRAGARADLLLLDANPLAAIENSLRIHGVVVNGRWIGAAERARLLEGLAGG